MISRKETTDLRVVCVVEHIREDCCVSIQALAKRINLSRSRLQHVFLEQTGVSLGMFISEARLNEAAQLLRNTHKQVKEISYDVGYRHPSSFVRAFKSRYDVAPVDFRNHP